MNNNQTLEKMRPLRLFGIHNAFKTSLKNTRHELMPHLYLVNSEYDNRRKRADLLILDDFDMQPFDSQSRGILMDIIEDCYQKH